MNGLVNFMILTKKHTTPNSVSEANLLATFFTFAKISTLDFDSCVYWFLQVIGFLDETAMASYYHEQWLKARLTEGASQRVQEDTLKFLPE